MTEAMMKVLTKLSEIDDWVLATGMGIFILAMCLLLAVVSLIDSMRAQHLKSSKISYGDVTFTQRPVRRKKNNEQR